MGDEVGAEIFERFTAGDVVVVVVAVNNVLDWLARHLLDLIDIRGDGLRSTETDWIGRNDAIGRHDEHRLVALITEYIDVVGPFDLCGGECRRRGWGCCRWLRLGRGQRSRK